MQMIINIYFNRSCDTFYLCVGSVDMVHFFVLVKTPTVFFFHHKYCAIALCVWPYCLLAGTGTPYPITNQV